MIKVEKAIDPQTNETFQCVYDLCTCLPIEPIQRFLNHCRKRGLAFNTVSTYAYRLADFWHWLEHKSLDWSEVGIEELADFMNWYLLGGDVAVISEGLQELISKRSSRTVNQAITVIQSMYEFHAISGRIDEKRFCSFLSSSRNKQVGFLKGIVKSTPEKRKRIKIKDRKLFPGCLTDEEIIRLVEACTTYRDRLILIFLRETGIRRGELLGLHLEDVQDLDVRKRIRIVRRSNPNQVWAKGCEREVPILQNRETVQQTFHAYLLEEYPPEAEKLGHGMLFVNLQGKNIGYPMSADRLSKLFVQLHARTGIKAHPHLFRHTFATRMLQSGYLDHYVQQILGHSSITTTKDIYSHVLDEMDLNSFMEDDDDGGSNP